MPSHRISNETTTLGDIIKKKYLPTSEKTAETADVRVTFMRHLAKNILEENIDISDVKFPTEDEAGIMIDVVQFLSEDLGKVINDAEAKNPELSEADLARLVPDSISYDLAKKVRARIRSAVHRDTSSTTDSI